jgi:hypothetical protein
LEQLFAQHYQAFALRGTVVALLQSLSMLQTRNHLQFSDGGISVAVSDKTPVLQSIWRDFQSKYEQEKMQKKVSLNIAQILSTTSVGVHSEYQFVNGWYGIY